MIIRSLLISTTFDPSESVPRDLGSKIMLVSGTGKGADRSTGEGRAASGFFVDEVVREEALEIMLLEEPVSNDYGTL